MVSAANILVFGRGRSRPRLHALIVAVVALLAIVVGLVLALRIGGQSFDVRLSYAAQVLAAATCVACTGWRGLHVKGSQRLAWLCIAGVVLTDLIGCAGNSWTEAVLLQPRTQHMPSDVTSLIGVPFGLVSLIMLARAHLRFGRSRTLIDGLIILGSFIFALWALLFGPLLRGGYLTSNILVLSTPVTDLAYALVLITVAARARPEDARAIFYLGTGVAVGAISDLVLSIQNLSSNFVSGYIWDEGWIVAFLIGALAGATAQQTKGPRPSGQVPTGRAWHTYIPYAAVVFAAVGAIYALTFTSQGLDRVLGWDGAALITLLTVRQALALRENFSLTSELDSRTAELRSSEARFRSLVQNSSDAILVVDGSGTISYVSPSADRVLGIPFGEMLGDDLQSYVHADDRENLSRALRESIGSTQQLRLEFRMRGAGSWRHLEATPSDLLDDPNVRGIVLNTRDVTERHELEEQLRYQAFHDPLTGLANRARFRDRLEFALARAERQNTSIGIVFLDLDDFKDVNDTLGHHVGDLLLVEVARRLHEALRVTDTPARLGGDEFAVLLEGDITEALAQRVGRRIIEAISAPMTIEGTGLTLHASMGIAIGDSSSHAANLLRHADIAMYQAKSKGKADLTMFDAGMDLTTHSRMQFAVDMNEAIQSGQIEAFFQPIVDISSGEIVGAEALARWDHPTRGLLSPEDFIELSEETGQIIELGQQMLERGCQQVASWQKARPGVYVSVNISGRHFRDQTLVNDVETALRQARITGDLLVIEVTESALLSDIDESKRQMNQLRELGVRIALDDFGTGYSSLGYLHELPVDILKIDRSFIAATSENPKRGELVTVIHRLGQALSLTTIAEGVETKEQLEALRTLGVDQAQGYYFARPMPAVAASELMGGQFPSWEILARGKPHPAEAG
jgi:diguanylate cyclase (GGDEF)-like protein/PAS domain S-box-containing protein